MDTIEGLSEDEAKKIVKQAGYDWRVEERDGEPLEVDSDHKTNRISVKVNEGVVTSVRVG